MWYSINFSWYPPPANSTFVSRSTCGPPTRETSDTDGPTTIRSCPGTTASRQASPLYFLSRATHTLRNVCRSHRRKKTRVASDPTPNSTLNWPHDFTQFKTRNMIHGNIPSSKIDCKQDMSNKSMEQLLRLPERIRNFPEPIRIRYRIDTDTNQYFIARTVDFDVLAAGG